MLSFVKILALLVVGWLSISCDRCPPETEPNFRFYLQSEDTLKLKSIRALGAINNFRFDQFGDDRYATQSWDFLLPLSLNADSVTYVLDFEVRVDTCTIFYKRRFFHQENCGFVVDIEAPKDATSKTTFQDVQVSYESYIPTSRGGLFGNPEIIGLQVRAQL